MFLLQMRTNVQYFHSPHNLPGDGPQRVARKNEIKIPQTNNVSPLFGLSLQTTLSRPNTPKRTIGHTQPLKTNARYTFFVRKHCYKTCVQCRRASLDHGRQVGKKRYHLTCTKTMIDLHYVIATATLRSQVISLHRGIM